MSDKKQRKKRRNNEVDTYNLKNSLNKLNQKQVNTNSTTSTEFKIDSSEQGVVSSDLLANESLKETKLLLSINDRFSDKVDKLKDDIYSANEKIGQSTDSLRLELEAKIEHKISDKLFYGAIAVMVLISSIIYSLSYSHLMVKVESGSKIISLNKQKVSELNESVNSLEKILHKQEKRIFKIEIESQVLKKK